MGVMKMNRKCVSNKSSKLLDSSFFSVDLSDISQKYNLVPSSALVFARICLSTTLTMTRLTNALVIIVLN